MLSSKYFNILEFDNAVDHVGNESIPTARYLGGKCDERIIQLMTGVSNLISSAEVGLSSQGQLYWIVDKSGSLRMSSDAVTMSLI